MRLASLVILVLTSACVDTVEAPETTSEGGGAAHGAADSDCTGTCSTHLEGSTDLWDLCGFQGALTNSVGTLYCDEGSSCERLDTLHRCMNDACYDLCTVTPPSMISPECRSCLDGGCLQELDACLADVP